MLVKRLIRELMKCDPEAVVSTEGCDCYGDSYCITYNAKENEVMIERDHLPHGRYNNSHDTPEPYEP